VLVRDGCVFRAVGGGLRLVVALVDVRLDVVPLPPRSSSPTVAGCRLGGILLDTICGVERAVCNECKFLMCIKQHQVTYSFSSTHGRS
jgi:hypothetical protein